MKKHILAAIGIVLISVPCFAQGIKADSLSAGSVASSGSIDGSGNIVLSNSFTGAHSLIGTNAHLMFVDQYGTEFYFWTNGFGFWKTNGDYAYATNGGDFHISGTFYGGGLGGSGPTNWPWSSITNQPTIPSTANLLATNGNASALTGLTSAQIAAAGGVTNSPPQPVLFRFCTTPNLSLSGGLVYLSVQYGGVASSEYSQAMPVGCTGIASNFCVHVYNYAALPTGTNLVFRFSTNGVGTGNALAVTETGGGGTQFSWFGQDTTGSFPVTSPTNLISITCSNTGGAALVNQTVSGWFLVYPTNNLNAILP